MKTVSKNRKLPLPGLRNIKTALSVFVCLIVYQTLGRDNAFIAITSAIICIQDSVDKSLNEGLDRVFGTIAGGLFGLLFITLGFTTSSYLVKDIGITLGCVLVIYICNLVRKPDLIINTVFVFILVVMVDESELTPVSYAINRIIDTVVGIVIAVTINRFLFPPKARKLSYKRAVGTVYQLKKDLVYLKVSDYKKSTWAGGDALELMIYPKNCLYEDFDFKYRVSVSAMKGVRNLPVIPSYYRHTMILEGEAIFSHEGGHTIYLNQFDQDFFKGNFMTNTVGETINFNVMINKNNECELKTVYNGDKNDLVSITLNEIDKFETTLFYSLYEQNVITITRDGFVVFVHVINKGESIIFRNLQHFSLDELVVSIENSTLPKNKEVLAVRANIK